MSTASRTSDIGISTPMMPVLAMRTSSSGRPSFAAASAVVAFASISPCGPTQALAQPLFATTAWARPSATRSRVSVTDGETMVLWVNMPAAAQGRSETRRPKSSLACPYVFSPANVAPAENPSAEVTPPPSIGSTVDAMRASVFFRSRPHTIHRRVSFL